VIAERPRATMGTGSVSPTLDDDAEVKTVWGDRS